MLNMYNFEAIDFKATYFWKIHRKSQKIMFSTANDPKENSRNFSENYNYKLHSWIDLLTPFEPRAQTFRVIVELPTDYHGHTRSFFRADGLLSVITKKFQYKNSKILFQVPWWRWQKIDIAEFSRKQDFWRKKSNLEKGPIEEKFEYRKKLNFDQNWLIHIKFWNYDKKVI